MISEKWKVISKNWLGIDDSKHCHWCKSIKHDDGESHCSNPNSKFNDGDRIRTWDGVYCATNCNCFELDEYYTSDETYDNYFGVTNETDM